jgi:hypothetical protein
MAQINPSDVTMAVFIALVILRRDAPIFTIGDIQIGGRRRE